MYFECKVHTLQVLIIHTYIVHTQVINFNSSKQSHYIINLNIQPILRQKNNQNTINFFYKYIVQLFSVDTTMFKKKFKHFFTHKNMKKPPSKVAHNRQIFFSVLPTGPKPAQILELVSKELNHFGVIAGLFRQIGDHSSRFGLFCSF